MFVNARNRFFKELPTEFEDHQDYLERWEPLYFYEVYSHLMNTFEGFAATLESSEKQLMWVGYCVTGTAQELRMYSKPPNPHKLDADHLQTSKEDDLINQDFDILKVRRNDLLLISTEKIDFTGINNFKKMGPEYINKLLSGSSAMLALVTKTTAGIKKKKDYLE